MRIDSHQHYWKIARGDYGWITPDNDILYQDYMPVDLNPHLQEFQFDGSIVVQAAPTIEETYFILSLSVNTTSVLGVVGWLDLFDPDFKKYYEEFKRYSKFVGIRLMIQDMTDPSAVLKPDVVKALSYFSDNDVPVDLLVTSEQLPILIKLLEKVPELRGVLDHLGKPPIASREMRPWQDHIQNIASHPNIYCKLSGMVTENDFVNWKTSDFVPYVHHIIESFGTNRIMFGSDWPVCLQAANYEDVLQLLSLCLPNNISTSEQEALFGNNAKKFYKLKSNYKEGVL